MMGAEDFLFKFSSEFCIYRWDRRMDFPMPAMKIRVRMDIPNYSESKVITVIETIITG